VLELLTPGRFHSRGDRDGLRTAYAESLDQGAGALENIFISDFRYAEEGSPGQLVTVYAGSGRIVEDQGLSYLHLMSGFQYQGSPGDADYRQVAFEEALVRVGQDSGPARPPRVRSFTTQRLWSMRGSAARAELQWRISLVVLVPLMIIAAVPLSQVNPRQGRFNRLVPALLGYLIYVGLLLVMRSRIAETPMRRLEWYQHMGWIHLAALLVVILLLNEHWIRQWFGRLRRRGS